MVTPSSSLFDLMLSTLSKISADDILKQFSYFPQKQDWTFHANLSPMETICMKCQILFSGKNITSLSSAELAQKVVKVSKFKKMSDVKHLIPGRILYLFLYKPPL